jgi:hypothetical protein
VRIEPSTEGANGRTGPVVSEWSGGVGLVCGMKRGICSPAAIVESARSGELIETAQTKFGPWNPHQS